MDISIIGKQIENRRKEKGLSQSALAEMLFVTPQAVSKWERSESLPDIFMLAKISDIFDIYDLGYFLGKQNPCPCGFCDCESNKIKGGEKMETCENFTTIEQFVGVLIRGVKGIKGLGSLTRRLEINKDFDKEDLLMSNRIWIEDTGIMPKFSSTPRIGIDYADKPDIEKLWRFTAYENL